MIYVNDLITEKGVFYSQAEIELMFNIKINFIQFQGIIQIVKQYAGNYRVNFTHKLQCPIIPVNLGLFTKSQKGGKQFYIALNRNDDEPTPKTKWGNIYDIDTET